MCVCVCVWGGSCLDNSMMGRAERIDHTPLPESFVLGTYPPLCSFIACPLSSELKKQKQNKTALQDGPEGQAIALMKNQLACRTCTTEPSALNRLIERVNRTDQITQCELPLDPSR